MTAYYDSWMKNTFYCTSYHQFYSVLEMIADDKFGINKLPFTLSDLEHPPGNRGNAEITAFITKVIKALNEDNSEEEAIQLIKFLKENPPIVSFENPKLPTDECTFAEKNLMGHIFHKGIDLPGSQHNSFGHLQYFSSFFIDMFFGNYTECLEHITDLTKNDLKKALERREGYCQYSPIFAPILGMKFKEFESNGTFTKKEIESIKRLYNGANENKHLEILKKLFKLGADVNAYDIHGYTVLHYATVYGSDPMLILLLKHGADPNAEARNGFRPLTFLAKARYENIFRKIEILLQYNAKMGYNDEGEAVDTLRSNIETFACRGLALKVRAAHPRRMNECEKCTKFAEKKCSGCKLVQYCTPSCQKLDWTFHKLECQKN